MYQALLLIFLNNENLSQRFNSRVQYCWSKDIFELRPKITLIKNDATRPRKICGREKCALFSSAVRKFLHILYLGHRAKRAVELWRSLRYWSIFTEVSRINAWCAQRRRAFSQCEENCV